MVVQGHAQEEKLIAAAKAVASSTAQLLIACQVKADARSENNRRLQVKERGEGRKGREGGREGREGREGERKGRKGRERGKGGEGERERREGGGNSQCEYMRCCGCCLLSSPTVLYSTNWAGMSCYYNAATDGWNSSEEGHRDSGGGCTTHHS